MARRDAPRPRRIPQRTCVVCRSTTAKRQLVRIVRTPPGKIELDTTGKRPGRGAYLCQRLSCWEQALSRKRLEQALKTPLDETARQELMAYARSLPPVE